MTVTMAFVTTLVCLVAMVATAPTMERPEAEDLAVSSTADGPAMDRAQENFGVFGPPQTGAEEPSIFPVKTHSRPFVFPPFVPDLTYAREAIPYKIFAPQADNNRDKTGSVYASEQMPLAKAVQEETASELQAAMPEDGGPNKEGEVEKQTEIPEQNSSEKSEANDGTDEKPTGEAMGQEQAQQTPEVGAEPQGVDQTPENADPSHENWTSSLQATAPSRTAAEPEVQTPHKSRLPEDSRKADAEEAFHVKDQKINTDDIELFLKDLEESAQGVGDARDRNDGTEERQNVKEDVTEEGKEEESAEEAELMQMASQSPQTAEKAAESEDYRKQLLDYLLENGDKYGRVPVSYASYPYSYYLQRRRRSLSRHRLPHIHRRRRSGSRQLTRAKRTKRDLFDDELYYNPDAQYALQQAEQQEEEKEEKQAQLGEFISYLMALYPALYDNRPPPQGFPYPGYFWYNSAYPDEAYPEYPQWEEEEPDYPDIPSMGDWQPPSQPVQAWEPVFYPEEVEEPSYYPKYKRQMSVPVERLKRDFYPYAQEPYVHWGAFMPSQEKRDYDEAYWRLKDLARVLADTPQSSPYVDAFSDYRKK